MMWYYLTYTTIVFVSAAVETFLALYAWRHRDVTGATGLFWILLSGVGWQFFLALEILSQDLALKIFWNHLRFSFINFLPYTVLLFTLQYCGKHSWLRPGRQLLIVSPFVVALFLNWFNPSNMFWQDYRVIADGSFLIPERILGPAQLIQLLYVYVLTALVYLLLLHTAYISPPPYRKRTLLVFLAFVPVFLVDITYVLQLIPGLALSPIVNSLVTLMIAWLLFRFRLIDLVPVAHHVLVQNMPDGLVVLDTQHRVVNLNPSAQELTGLTTQHAIGHHYTDVLPAWQPWLEPLLSEQGGQTDFTDKQQGDFHSFDVQVSYVTNRRDQLTGWMVVLRDVTARTQAEEALRKSEADLARAHQIAGLGNFRQNILTGELVWSAQFCRIAGLGDEEKRTTIDEIYTLLHPDDAELLWGAFREVLNGSGRAALDVRLVRPDGSIRHLHDQFEAVYDELGRVVEIFGTVQDITTRKLFEEELRAARNAAEAANRAKSAFLANMSHELRTPLNAILGFTRLLEHQTLDRARTEEYLNIIRRSGEHLLTLINDVLDMAKIESGHVSLENHRFDLHAMLQELQMTFQNRATQKNLLLQVSHAPDVPRYIVADDVKLRQVLINLLSNAIKFTSNGSVTCLVETMGTGAITTRRHDGATCTLSFAVQDTGPGIEPADQPSLFEPFTQFHNEGNSSEGTGLGLSISQRFIHLMGGKMTVQSTPGEGATFAFTLPVGVADQTESKPKPAPRRVVALAEGQPDMRVLVVDDEWNNRLLLLSLLEPLGFDIREAGNGQEAVECYHTWKPHLVLMDLRMPLMDGYEATRRIRASEPGRRTCILAVTASIADDKREHILAAGCDDVVFKPFQEDELFEKIETCAGIRFVYADATADPTSASDTDQNGHDLSSAAHALAPMSENEQSLQARMQALPPELLATLEHAAIVGNVNTLQDIIVQVRAYDVELAADLDRLAQQFAYARILHLLGSEEVV